MMSLIISVFQKIPIAYVNRGNGWHNQAEGDDRQVLAVDLNAGKDGTVTALDGRLFHTGINLAKKEYLYALTKEDN